MATKVTIKNLAHAIFTELSDEGAGEVTTPEMVSEMYGGKLTRKQWNELQKEVLSMFKDGEPEASAKAVESYFLKIPYDSDIARDIAIEIIYGGDRFDTGDIINLLSPLTSKEVDSLREDIRYWLNDLDGDGTVASEEFRNKMLDIWTQGFKPVSEKESNLIRSDFKEALRYAKNEELGNESESERVFWALGCIGAFKDESKLPELLKQHILPLDTLTPIEKFELSEPHLRVDQERFTSTVPSVNPEHDYEKFNKLYPSLLDCLKYEYGEALDPAESIADACVRFVSMAEKAGYSAEAMELFTSNCIFEKELREAVQKTKVIYFPANRIQASQMARNGVKSYSSLTLPERGTKDVVYVLPTDAHVNTARDTESELYLPVKDIISAREKGIFRRGQREILAGIVPPENVNRLSMETRVIDYYLRKTEDGEYKVKNPFENVLTSSNPAERAVSVNDMMEAIKGLYITASLHPDKRYYITSKYGQLSEFTDSGYMVAELIAMFRSAGPIPENIYFPESWAESKRFLSAEERAAAIKELAQEKDNLQKAQAALRNDDNAAASEAEHPEEPVPTNDLKTVNGHLCYDHQIRPEPNMVFVFGSNTEGRHGAGSASVAVKEFGAKYGTAEGPQGNAWAIVTKDLAQSARLGLYTMPSLVERKSGNVPETKANWDEVENRLLNYYQTHPFSDVLDANPAQRSIEPQRILAQFKNLFADAKAHPDKTYALIWNNPVLTMSLSGYLGGEMMAIADAAGPIPENVAVPKTWAESTQLTSSLSDEKRKELLTYELNKAMKRQFFKDSENTKDTQEVIFKKTVNMHVKTNGEKAEFVCRGVSMSTGGRATLLGADEYVDIPVNDLDIDTLQKMLSSYNTSQRGKEEPEDIPATDTVMLWKNCMVTTNEDGTFNIVDGEGHKLHDGNVTEYKRDKAGIVTANLVYDDGSVGAMKIVTGDPNKVYYSMTKEEREARRAGRKVLTEPKLVVKPGLPKIYSMGTGMKSTEDFFAQAKAFGITDIFDVRSSAKSRNADFAGDAFSASCEAHGIIRTYEGNRAGGHPSGNFREDVDYTALAAEPQFKEFVRDLVAAAKEPGRKIALVCSESNPAACHRAMLIGQELERAGLAEMVHIVGEHKALTQKGVVETVLADNMPGYAPSDNSVDYLKYNFRLAFPVGDDPKAMPSMVSVPVGNDVAIKGIYNLEDVVKAEKVADSNPNSETENKEPKTAPRLTLMEDDDFGYQKRTVRNAAESDVTLSFAVNGMSSGEILTRNAAGEKGISIALDNKKYPNDKYTPDIRLSVDNLFDPDEVRRVASEIISAMNKRGISTKDIHANIAGNALATLTDVGISKKDVNQFMSVLIRELKVQGLSFAQIRSGGQTGFDQAGLHAAIVNQIPALAFTPKNFRRQVDNGELNEKGYAKSVYGKESFLAEFSKSIDYAVKNEHTTKEKETRIVTERLLADSFAKALLSSERQEEIVASKNEYYFLYNPNSYTEEKQLELFVRNCDAAGVSPLYYVAKAKEHIIVPDDGNLPDQYRAASQQLVLLNTRIDILADRLSDMKEFGFRMYPESDADESVTWADVAKYFGAEDLKKMEALVNDTDETARIALINSVLDARRDELLPELSPLELKVSNLKSKLDALQASTAAIPFEQAVMEWGQYGKLNLPRIDVSSNGFRDFSASNMRFDPDTIIHIGDRIVNIGGRTIEDVYLNEVKRSSKNDAPGQDSVLKGEFKSEDEAQEFSYINGYRPLALLWAEQHPSKVASFREDVAEKVADSTDGHVCFTDPGSDSAASHARVWADILADVSFPRGSSIRFKTLRPSVLVYPAKANEVEMFKTAPVPFNWPSTRTVVFTNAGPNVSKGALELAIPKEADTILDVRSSNASGTKHLSASGLRSLALGRGSTYSHEKGLSTLNISGDKAKAAYEALKTSIDRGRHVCVLAGGNTPFSSTQMKGLAMDLARDGVNVVFRTVAPDGSINDMPLSEVVNRVLEREDIYIAQGHFGSPAIFRVRLSKDFA